MRVIIKGKKIQTYMALWVFFFCPLNRITGWGTLSSNNCNQAFEITCNERCGWILAHSSLQNCCYSVTLEGSWAWIVFLRSCQVRTLNRPLQSLHFVVDVVVCFGSLCWCRTQDCFCFRSQTVVRHSPSEFFGRQLIHGSIYQVFQVLR